jgi:hypothetical protein
MITFKPFGETARKTVQVIEAGGQSFTLADDSSLWVYGDSRWTGIMPPLTHDSSRIVGIGSMSGRLVVVMENGDIWRDVDGRWQPVEDIPQY